MGQQGSVVEDNGLGGGNGDDPSVGSMFFSYIATAPTASKAKVQPAKQEIRLVVGQRLEVARRPRVLFCAILRC